MTWETTDWWGLYRERWGETITKDASEHPAKYAPALIRQIYAHAVSAGWLAPGATVLDPFGGVALGAPEALRLGLNWYGMELEERWVRAGSENIADWCRTLLSVGKPFGTAVLVQGDSRYLLQGGQAIISSPPWGEGADGHTRAGKHNDPGACAAGLDAHRGRSPHPASV